MPCLYVLDHLPQEHRRSVRQKLNNAYAMAEYAEARRALDRLHRELMDLNPSAARNLAEGLEETLTVHKLRVPAALRKTLASTNVMESAFFIAEMIWRNVKRWRGGDHWERCVGSALLVAERSCRSFAASEVTSRSRNCWRPSPPHLQRKELPGWPELPNV